MGLDLKLLPLDYLSAGKSGPWGYSHTVLSVNRNSELFDAIALLDDEELPQGASIASYVGGDVPDGAKEGETCYGVLDQTPYGDRCTWIDVEALVPAFAKHMSDQPVTAYLRAMRPGTKIVLYWH